MQVITHHDFAGTWFAFYKTWKTLLMICHMLACIINIRTIGLNCFLANNYHSSRSLFGVLWCSFIKLNSTGAVWSSIRWFWILKGELEAGHTAITFLKCFWSIHIKSITARYHSPSFNKSWHMLRQYHSCLTTTYSPFYRYQSFELHKKLQAVGIRHFFSSGLVNQQQCPVKSLESLHACSWLYGLLEWGLTIRNYTITALDVYYH